MSTPEIVTEVPPLKAEVEAIRKATGWSQNRVARRARVNGGLLSGLLSGRFNPLAPKSKTAEARVRRLAEQLRKAGRLDGQGVGA
jgi:transcriptional regulator with XRE-family HTH domain